MGRRQCYTVCRFARRVGVLGRISGGEAAVSAENLRYVTFNEDAPITIGTLANTKMLDGAIVTDFGAQVLEFVSERSDLNLLLDFAAIDYLASSALTELIKINDKVVAGGGALRICGLTLNVEKVFEITNFAKIFEISPGEGREHATSRFKRSIEISKEEEAWDKRHER